VLLVLAPQVFKELLAYRELLEFRELLVRLALWELQVSVLLVRLAYRELRDSKGLRARLVV